VLLGDFGNASVLPFTEKRDKTSIKNYWAPERLLNGITDFSADIWSVGCIMAELLERKIPFWGEDRADIVRSITLLLGTPTQHVLKKVYRCSNQICAEINSTPAMDQIDFTKRFPRASLEGKLT
jgi:serine/threonine protein kinase